MNDAARIADALRPIAPGGKLGNDDVPHLDAIAANWARRLAETGHQQATGAGPVPKSLHNPAAFWDRLRGSLARSFNQSQVDGFTFLLGKMAAAGWPVSWAAYGLATAWHETAQRMQPVREGLDVSDAWRRAHLKYYPWYGRGYPQTTWEENYRKADEKLGLGGTLIANPDRMLEPEIAAETMIRGMTEGWFAGDAKGRHTLARHLPDVRSTPAQRESARRIINGIDRAGKIGGEAEIIEEALVAGGWA